jgi:hypothetical protein
MTEIIVQIAIALIGVGTFVGQTRHALNVLEKRLDSLDQKVQTCSTALVALELRYVNRTPLENLGPPTPSSGTTDPLA